MNPTDRQRKLLFGGLIAVLGGVGVYLTLAPSGHGDRAPEGARTTASAAPAGPASPPPGIAGSVGSGPFDIYRLLPFSQREFGTAADIAQRFVAAYGTYRYDETPDAYGARLAGLVTDDLLGQLRRGSAAPGLQDERRAQRVVAQSGATLDRVRDIEDNSIIFLVTAKQTIDRDGKTSRSSRQYAVTVTRDGDSLKVYAFEPADAGQKGDTG
ncbi:hypothetical protein [Actinomadura atramentaria]|uniref:hypothetical protein n=1 Tax=Actinomadura atramentaria TaxID=1990 RepID=UPI000360CB47|nr:hypothetical protein [Actinomadura atramentaria]